MVFVLLSSNVYGFYKLNNPIKNMVQEEIKKSGEVNMKKTDERLEKAKKDMGKLVNPSKTTGSLKFGKKHEKELLKNIVSGVKASKK